MRRFHYKRNPDFCPTINIDRLWSLVPEGVFEKAQAGAEQAPVIDVTKLVYISNFRFTALYFTHPFLFCYGRGISKSLEKVYYQHFPS